MAMAVDQVAATLQDLGDLHRACEAFLYREAELLDENRYVEWFESCLSKRLAYRVPVRTTREQASGVSEFSTVAYHMDESHDSMEIRVKRLLTEHAFAEDPPSRTRRLVTNVRVRPTSDDEVEVRSYLQLYRSQWDTETYDLIVAERQDVLGLEAGELRVARRLVLLTHTIIGTGNLALFM